MILDIAFGLLAFLLLIGLLSWADDEIVTPIAKRIWRNKAPRYTEDKPHGR